VQQWHKAIVQFICQQAVTQRIGVIVPFSKNQFAAVSHAVKG